MKQFTLKLEFKKDFKNIIDAQQWIESLELTHRLEISYSICKVITKGPPN